MRYYLISVATILYIIGLFSNDPDKTHLLLEAIFLTLGAIFVTLDELRDKWTRN